MIKYQSDFIIVGTQRWVLNFCDVCWELRQTRAGDILISAWIHPKMKIILEKKIVAKIIC